MGGEVLGQKSMKYSCKDLKSSPHHIPAGLWLNSPCWTKVVTIIRVRILFNLFCVIFLLSVGGYHHHHTSYNKSKRLPVCKIALTPSLDIIFFWWDTFGFIMRSLKCILIVSELLEISPHNLHSNFSCPFLRFSIWPVSLSVHVWKPRFSVKWRLLVKEHIVYISLLKFFCLKIGKSVTTGSVYSRLAYTFFRTVPAMQVFSTK